ncbi:MAG: DUF333 domain-containing protein [Candidatus Micrarchaeia archaeon]
MTNPASTNCVDKGGKLEIVKNSDGSESGMCTLADGTVCEEWAYFRGECPAPVANMTNPASTNCIANGGTLNIAKDANGGEVGMCTLADGTVCEEWAYFRGECPSGSPDTLVAAKMFDSIGSTLELGDMRIKFNGFNPNDDYPFPPSLQIFNENGILLATKKINVKTAETYTAPDNATYDIYVEETGNGYSNQAKWALVRVYKIKGDVDSVNMTKSYDDPNPYTITDSGAQKDALALQKTIKIGETADAGALKIKLDDIAADKENSSPAMLSILDANGTVERRMIIAPMEMRVYNASATDRYAIYVEQTAPAANMANSWAKVWVYRINGEPDVQSISPEFRNSTTGWPQKTSQQLSLNGVADAGVLKVRLDDISTYPVDTKSAIVSLLAANGDVLDKYAIAAGYGVFYVNKDQDRFLVFCDSTGPGMTAKISVYEK